MAVGSLLSSPGGLAARPFKLPNYGGGWTPRTHRSLGLWYHAGAAQGRVDSGVVRVEFLPDLGLAGAHLSAASGEAPELRYPTVLKGRPALYFSGSPRKMTAPNPTGTFAGLASNEDGTGDKTVFTVVVVDNTSGHWFAGKSEADGNEEWTLAAPATTLYFDGGSAGNWVQTPASAYLANTAYLLEGHCGSPSTTARFYRNGGLVTTRNGANTGDGGGTQRIALGASRLGAPTYTSGAYIAELLLYRRLLPDFERNHIARMLTDYYGAVRAFT